MNRNEALGRLRTEAEAGRPIIGAGAGTGLSAKCAEAGGVDLIIYNSETGGESMENLVEGGFISAVLDVATTELCDELAEMDTHINDPKFAAAMAEKLHEHGR